MAAALLYEWTKMSWQAIKSRTDKPGPWYKLEPYPTLSKCTLGQMMKKINMHKSRPAFIFQPLKSLCFKPGQLLLCRPTAGTDWIRIRTGSTQATKKKSSESKRSQAMPARRSPSFLRFRSSSRRRLMSHSSFIRRSWEIGSRSGKQPVRENTCEQPTSKIRRQKNLNGWQRAVLPQTTEEIATKKDNFLLGCGLGLYSFYKKGMHGKMTDGEISLCMAPELPQCNPAHLLLASAAVVSLPAALLLFPLQPLLLFVTETALGIPLRAHTIRKKTTIFFAIADHTSRQNAVCNALFGICPILAQNFGIK